MTMPKIVLSEPIPAVGKTVASAAVEQDDGGWIHVRFTFTDGSEWLGEIDAHGEITSTYRV